MIHRFKPTDEFNREVLEFANKGGPDRLRITTNKAVKLSLQATRSGKVLFELNDIALSKVDVFELADFSFEITIS